MKVLARLRAWFERDGIDFDTLDGVDITDRCAVLACPEPPVTEIHGVKLCAGHRDKR